MYNTSIQYNFNPHLFQNTSPTYGLFERRNFRRFLTKIFLLQNMFYTFYFTFPNAYSKIFFRTFNTFVTLTFSLFEICSCQSFFCFQSFLLLLFSSLLLKMNSHFNLDYSKLLHFWFTQPPMLFHNSLTQHALTFQPENIFMPTNSC